MSDEGKEQLLAEITALHRQMADLSARQEKLVAEVHRQARELEVLLQLEQAITANLGLDKVLEAAYLGVGKLMPNEAFWIATYQSGAAFYRYLIVIDRGKSYPLAERSIEHGVGGYVIRTGQPLLITDPDSQNLFPTARYGTPDPIRAVLCVPLRIGDRLVGVMSTQSYRVDAYTEADLELLARLAQPIAIALENAQLYQAIRDRAQELGQANEKLQQEIARREQAEISLRKYQEHLEEQVARRTAELSRTNKELQREIVERKQAAEKRAAQERFLTLLNDITYTALKTSNLQEMLQILANRLGELTQADGCYITLWDEAAGMPIPTAASGELHHQYRLTKANPDQRNMTRSVLEAGHALVAGDVFNTPYMDPRIAVKYPARSILALPLIANQQKLGAALIAFNIPHHFGPDEIAYGEQAAQQVALAIAKVKLFEALKESEARYQSLFEYATDAIFIETMNGEILDANEKACQLLGYSREELLSLNVADIVPNRLFTESVSIRSVLKERNHLLFETKNRRKDGSLVDVEVSMRLIGLEDQEIAQVFVRDITRRKQMEEQLQQLKKIEAISLLAGGIAHDFNNLLTVISGNCEMILANPDLDDQTRQDVKKIDKAGKRAATLTQQLLAFSRQQTLLPQITDLNALVTRMEAKLRRSITKDIELIINLEPKLDLVAVDPDQFEQVILSLVSNACDAMPYGGQLTLETGNIHLAEGERNLYLNLDPGRYVMLSISDTGQGMDQITQGHLFEPFFTTKKSGQGVGLGLAMVHGIIEQSQGYIRFQSEPAQGTRFTIFLPRVEESDFTN